MTRATGASLTFFLLCSLIFLLDSALARVGEADHHRKLQPGRPGTVVGGAYIIIFDSTRVGGSANQMHGALNGIINSATRGPRVQHRFHRGFRGFFVKELNQQQLNRVLASDLVKSVEEVVETHQVDATSNWNLDRIDETAYSLMDGTYDYNPTYSGQDVDIYILDSGVYGHTGYDNTGPNQNVHPDIADRYQQCVDYTGEDSPAECVTPSTNGHGTHVACTATGTMYGVSKSARVHDRKINNSNGGGDTGRAASAVDDIMATYENEPAGSFKVVINMSIATAPGGTSYNSLDTIVDAAADMGIVVVVASGNNQGADACTVSPARAQKAVTVGGFKHTGDIVSPFSNIGPCVDIYAPGNKIVSGSQYGGELAMAGTSVASPHVAGAIANYMSADVADPVGRLLSDAVLMTGTTAGDVKFLYTGLMSPDSAAPSETPSVSPIGVPSSLPSQLPSAAPSETPSVSPTGVPSSSPSQMPTHSSSPSETPSLRPSMQPSGVPSIATSAPSMQPSGAPSLPAPICLPKKEFCVSSDDCCNECRCRRRNCKCT